MKYIFTLFGMFLIFNLFSQDLKLEKIETTKAKISYPLELKFGYGALLSLNNDSIINTTYQTIFDTTLVFTFTYPMLKFDTLNKINYYSSYNFGARKRFGNFRLGLNLKYSYLNNYHMNPYKDNYWTIGGVTLLTNDFENNKLMQKTNLWVLNLTSDYIFLETKKIQMAVGFSAGGLNFTDVVKYTSSSIRYNYSYQNNGSGGIITLNSVDTISQDKRVKNQNFSLNLIPSFSLAYKFSNLIKAELSAFYIFQLNNNIKISGTNNYTLNGMQIPLGNFEYQRSFQNPSKIGLNLNLIFCLGKEKNK